ncbi:hypothetical protein [Nocardiopsis suaedae]|uniref:Uncharacterized protein n=1 Tax=Nocardiopsis suaedae TaxID=3018444 RepID=A0ABT4TUD0_9ACTN|nr:hypothetical protein [Nocardiopsis suaedae]MDA2808319.1 hypothetical protein [Nocardiopsis suaedae]
MADFVFVGVAAAFFTLCVAYVRGCDRIIAAGGDADADASADASAGVSPE